MEIQVGQIWKENDPRFDGWYERRLEVFYLDEFKVGIRNKETGRESYAKRSRFNGKRGGYSLVSQALKEGENTYDNK